MQDNAQKTDSNQMNSRSFASALVMIFILMVITYVLTLLLPGGTYTRVMENGSETVVAGTYQQVPGGIPFWQWLLSPILVLTAEGNVSIIAILLFLAVIGGIFHCLNESGLMRYALHVLHHRFADKKYALLCAVTMFFMAMGALIGSFEECVPLVPIVVALACSLGWDALVGMGMSLLAVGCGFATGVCNPFTVGVAQQLAGLPMFSGAGPRLLTFGVVYLCLTAFLLLYVRKIEKNPKASLLYGQPQVYQVLNAADFEPDKTKGRALLRFALLLALGICVVFCSAIVPALQAVSLPIVAVVFLVAGLVALKAARTPWKQIGRGMWAGIVEILPAMLLILMASSIRYTLTESNVMDTLLYSAIRLVEGLPRATTLLLIYGLTLLAEFFIASGSAKAFLLIPLMMPLLDLAGIDRQLGIMAFAFGDGFSNVFYFTNPVLLISLGLVHVSYGKWLKFSWKIELVILVLTAGILWVLV